MPRENGGLRYANPPYEFHELFVMAGLVPAIHVFGVARKEEVDARVKPGHDGGESGACAPYSPPSICRPISAMAFWYTPAAFQAWMAAKFGSPGW